MSAEIWFALGVVCGLALPFALTLARMLFAVLHNAQRPH